MGALWSLRAEAEDVVSKVERRTSHWHSDECDGGRSDDLLLYDDGMYNKQGIFPWWP